jgi:hypothetical protein
LIHKEFFGFQDSFIAKVDTLRIPKWVILVCNLYVSGELEKARMNWKNNAETVLLVALIRTGLG